MSPWPGAYVETPDGPIKLHGSQVIEGQGIPGQVIALDPLGPVVACGEGAVCLTGLQRPGKRRVTGTDYLRGTQLAVGDPIAPPRP